MLEDKMKCRCIVVDGLPIFLSKKVTQTHHNSVAVPAFNRGVMRTDNQQLVRLANSTSNRWKTTSSNQTELPVRADEVVVRTTHAEAAFFEGLWVCKRNQDIRKLFGV